MSVTAIEEVSLSADPVLAKFQKKFQESLVPSLRGFREELGELLVEARDEMSSTQFRMFGKWLSHNYQISDSAQQVAIRVAAGEVDPRVAERIPPSILKNVPTENVPQWEEEFNIYSPDAGGPVTKPFSDFSDTEIKHVADTKTGVMTIDDMTHPDRSKGFKTAVAKDYRVEDGNLVLVVNSMKLEVRIKIDDDLRFALAK